MYISTQLKGILKFLIQCLYSAGDTIKKTYSCGYKYLRKIHIVPIYRQLTIFVFTSVVFYNSSDEVATETEPQPNNHYIIYIIYDPTSAYNVYIQR